MKLLMVLVLALAPITSFAEKSTLYIIDDSKKAVECSITKINQQNGTQRLGKTSLEGTFAFTEKCISGERLKIHPENPQYYEKEIECPIKVYKLTIIVTKASYFANLIENAKMFERLGQIENAAMAYNEIAKRAATFDPKLSKEATSKVIHMYGKILDVKQPLHYDNTLKIDVLSPGMKKNLLDFQKRNELSPTGKIDFDTLNSLSDKQLSDMLFKKLSP